MPEDAHAPHVFFIAPLVHKTHTYREKRFRTHTIPALHRDESVLIVGGEDVKEYSKISLYQRISSNRSVFSPSEMYSDFLDETKMKIDLLI